MASTPTNRRSRIETVAYWTHGLFGVFMLMVLQDYLYMMMYLFMMPLAIPATLIAVISGFSTIPTAVLSLLLLAFITDFFMSNQTELVGYQSLIVKAYVLVCLLVVGYRIYDWVRGRLVLGH